MYKVIIADDEAKVSQLIKNLIDWESLNLENVAIANDGIMALELIKIHQPDIVITDIKMPGYEGIELIKKSKEINPNIDFVIVSGYQHFDYAHNAIKYGVKDYLLKPLKKNEINTTLSKMIEKYKEIDSEKSKKEKQKLEDSKRLKDKFLSNVYNISNEKFFIDTSIKQMNQEYQFYFKEGLFQGIIVKPDFDFNALDSDLMNMILNKIQKIVEQSLTTICYEMVCMPCDDRIFMVANYKSGDKKKIRKALVNIIDESHLFRDLFKNLMVTIGIGEAQNNIIGLNQSVNEAKKAIVDRLISGYGKIIEYSKDIDRTQSIESIITYERRRTLIDYIEVFNMEEIKKWMAELETVMTNQSNYSGQFVLDILYEVFEIIVYGLKNYTNVSINIDCEIEGLHKAIQMQNSVQNAFKVANYYIEKILLQVFEQRKKESNRPIHEARKYIDEHYASAIKLEEVSTFIGFNPTYFSTLFKKETGLNFLEYVTKVRIKAAKQLLSDSKKSTLDVSYEVGYKDFKHFTKQFKKITGLSPAKYRKLYY